VFDHKENKIRRIQEEIVLAASQLILLPDIIKWASEE
jgi:hypothetical protein